jgi:hypothetical protein
MDDWMQFKKSGNWFEIKNPIDNPELLNIKR